MHAVLGQLAWMDADEKIAAVTRELPAMLGQQAVRSRLCTCSVSDGGKKSTAAPPTLPPLSVGTNTAVVAHPPTDPLAPAPAPDTPAAGPSGGAALLAEARRFLHALDSPAAPAASPAARPLHAQPAPAPARSRAASLVAAAAWAGAAGDGIAPVLTAVCGALHAARAGSSRMRALETMAALAAHLSDTLRLGRVLPYAMAALADDAAPVRVTAVRVLTNLVCRCVGPCAVCCV
jgi:hypothetical protein